LRCGLGFGFRLFAVAVDLTLEDPHLDTNNSVGGARLGKTIVDISAQGVQRHTAFAVPFGTRDLRTVQTATDIHFDTLGS
jgi:hypothetical protein